MTAVARTVDRLLPEAERGEALYRSLTQDVLDLILFPTEQCNFRCVYCYEDFARGRMPSAVIAGIKSLIERRSDGLKHLSIAWFGGEPLVAYDIVRDIMEHAHALSVRKGFQLSSHATTNAYNLTASRIVESHAFGLRRFQVSLDGNQEQHDRTRIRIDGAGTFDRIWSNILAFDRLHREGAIPESNMILRVHVHPNNLESVYELIGRIDAELSSDAFSVIFERVGKFGGKNDAIFETFGRDQSRLSLEDSLHAMLPRFARAVSEKNGICYAARGNSFVIRSDGALAKCTVALNSEKNNIGRISETGELDLEPGKFAPWLHALSSMKVEDLRCPVRNLPSAAPA